MTGLVKTSTVNLTNVDDMAQKVVITNISDLSGSEASEQVDFSVAGKSYRLDLTDAELQEFHKVLQPYVDNGQPLSRRTSGGAGRRKVGGSNDNQAERQRIRAWAQVNGYEVGDRGRISQEIQNAFAAAQKK